MSFPQKHDVQYPRSTLDLPVEQQHFFLLSCSTTTLELLSEVLAPSFCECSPPDPRLSKRISSPARTTYFFHSPRCLFASYVSVFLCSICLYEELVEFELFKIYHDSTCKLPLRARYSESGGRVHYLKWVALP